VGSFVLPVVSEWDSYEKLHLMQCGASPHFTLSVSAWLENHFLVRGLGTQEQQNGQHRMCF
jgi:hypothetical protein